MPTLDEERIDRLFKLNQEIVAHSFSKNEVSDVRAKG